MLLDLVSPWQAAVEAPPTQAACAAFRQRHNHWLEPARRQRNPFLNELPLESSLLALQALSRRINNEELLLLLRRWITKLESLGADGCNYLILLAGDGSGGPAEALRTPLGSVVLFVEQCDSEAGMLAALTRSVAAATRWRAIADARSPFDGAASRWELASHVPLREWIYTEGLGVHLLMRVGDLSAHRALGLPAAAFHRLRQRERSLRRLLQPDLDQCGQGLLLRWLTPGATPAQRTTSDGVVIPDLAGRYLAWRLLAPRIAQRGLPAAIRAPA